VVKAVLRLRIAVISIPEYVSSWCGHGFESHLQPFLLTYSYSGLIKAYDFLSSLFIYETEALIAQLKGCLLDCFDWVLGFKYIARAGIDARFSCGVSLCASKK